MTNKQLAQKLEKHDGDLFEYAHARGGTWLQVAARALRGKFAAKDCAGRVFRQYPYATLYAPNSVHWQVGDLVLHDDDRKTSEYLMRVMGYTANGAVKAEYVARPGKIWLNNIYVLHDPLRFDIEVNNSVRDRLQSPDDPNYFDNDGCVGRKNDYYVWLVKSKNKLEWQSVGLKLDWESMQVLNTREVPFVALVSPLKFDSESDKVDKVTAIVELANSSLVSLLNKIAPQWMHDGLSYEHLRQLHNSFPNQNAQYDLSFYQVFRV